MAVEHKDIPAGDIHEPKGITGAAVGTVYTADGAGSGAWAATVIPGQDTAEDGSVLESDGAGGATWSVRQLQTVPVIDSSSSLGAQDPVGTDIPLQVVFGPAVSTPEVDLAADGTITVKTDRVLQYVFSVRVARSGGGGQANLLIRLTSAGAQVGPTTAYELNDANIGIPDTVTLTASVPVNTIVRLEVMRDSSGADDGGLRSFTPTDGTWTNSPSARVIINKGELA